MPSSIVIIGAGPNLGAAVARRFGGEGLSVGLIARDETKLAALVADLGALGIDAHTPPPTSLEFSVLGAVAAVTTVVQPMLERGSGTILFTTGGAAINPYPLRAGVGSRSPPRSRTRGCCTTNWPTAASTSAIPRSPAGSPRRDHEPDDIADVLWKHHVERSTFQVRIGID